MGLFKRKEAKKDIEELPELPKLPKLPGFPELSEESEFGHRGVSFEEKSLPKLPEYPANTINNKFFKNTIREAISGKKEEMFGVDEFVREQMMPEHLEVKPSDFARLNPEGKFEKSERGREQNKLEFPYKTENQKNFESRSWTEPKTRKSGQVFIKIDKFEESLKIFELTKNKIIEMEKMLDDIKSLKEKEERELSYWMGEIQTIKNQTEKVERDIFSKLE